MDLKLAIKSIALSVLLIVSATAVQASEISGNLNTGISTGIEGVIVSAPKADPASGTYLVLQNVSLKASGSTSIRYTFDGTAPTCSGDSSSVTYHMSIPVSETTTLKAIACYPNSLASSVSVFNYNFDTTPPTSEDKVKPVIVIVGSSNVSVVQNGTYVDAGATATDDVDGDITAKIVTESTVNIAVAGVYVVKYNVKDAAGNAAIEIARNVTVTAPVSSGGGGGGGGSSAPVIVGDGNNDSKVNKYDFALLMSDWGKSGSSTSDWNHDGVVNKYDFALLMAHWTN